MNVKLPFEMIQPSSILERLGKYERKYHSLECEIENIEKNYKRIMRNTFYYDLYEFDYKESNYFTFEGNNYGLIIGENYYKNNELIGKEEYEEKKKALLKEVEEKKRDYRENYEYLLENNYSFGMVQYGYSDKKIISIGKVKRWDNWYVLLDQEQLVLYSERGYVKIPKKEFTKYLVHEGCKGPVIVKIKDIKKLVNLLEENYNIEVLFKMAIGVKYTPEAILKKKVDLEPLDLEQYYDFELVKENEKGIAIPKQVVEELEKQEEGIYYLSIEKGTVEIVKSGEKKEIKIEIEDKEAYMKAVRVNLQKMVVKFTTDKVELVVREKDIVLMNGREYQVFERMELEESE